MPRIQFADLPDHVRAEVERIAGSAVVSASSQTGGFSPGTADRLLLADGHRVFAKAVSPDQNPHTPGLHRREVAVTAALPTDAPTPRLLGSFDDGFWVVLVLEDVEGRHPHEPWTASDLDACLAALDGIARTCTPCPVPDLPELPSEVGHDFAGWRRVQDDPTGVPELALAHLPELAELGDRSAGLCAGDSLVHLDVRADNLLVRTGSDRPGEVVLVDWPWASRGAPWYDSLALLINAEALGVAPGCADAETRLRTTPLLADLPRVTVDAVLAGFAGYFADVARQPASVGLPTLRAFQRRQGEAVLAWLGRRRGW